MYYRSGQISCFSMRAMSALTGPRLELANDAALAARATEHLDSAVIVTAWKIANYAGSPKLPLDNESPLQARDRCVPKHHNFLIRPKPQQKHPRNLIICSVPDKKDSPLCIGQRNKRVRPRWAYISVVSIPEVVDVVCCPLARLYLMPVR